MTNDEIRAACERALTLSNDFEDEGLRAGAFGAILTRLLQADCKTAEGSVSNTFADAKAGIKKARRSPRTIKPQSGGLTARILQLKSDGFFDSERTTSDIFGALKVAGWNHQPKEISARLIELVRKKSLRRAEIKGGKKASYKYSNW